METPQFSQDEALQMAQALKLLSNNYAGDQVANYAGDPLANYDGEHDFALDFGQSASNFADEGNGSEVYSYTLACALTGTTKLAICPAYFHTQRISGSNLLYDSVTEINNSGESVDAMLADNLCYIGAKGTISATSQDRPLAEFMNFIRNVPTRITEITISANNAAAFYETITEVPKSPFNKMNERKTLIERYFNPANQQLKAVINQPFQFDNNKLIYMTLNPAVTSLTISYRVGAMENPAVALRNKSKKATANLAKKGVQVAGLKK